MASRETLGPPTTIRLTKHAGKRIKAASAKLHKSDADLMRLLIDIGLTHLERIHYDIARAVLEASQNYRP